MALNDAYITLAQLKTYLGVADTADDTALTDAINSITEEIDEYCGRQFNVNGSATARVYQPSSPYLLEPDDISTATGLVVKVDSAGDGTYATTVAATNYELRPLNGVVDGRTGWPYTQICAVNYRWPTSWQVAPIQVTANWGWPAVPKAVLQSAYLLASETFGLRGARFGVAGYGEFGPVRVRDNPMVRAKLNPYRRHAVLVA
jgi:hypothetical protein